MANIMPSGSANNFTGTNGTSVAGTDFTVPKADNGGAATIQSNACRIRTGASVGNRTSIKMNIATRADAEVDFVWTVPNGTPTQFPYFYMRSGTFMDTASGYFFSLDQNDMNAGSAVSYSGSNIQTYSHGFTAGQVVHSRFAIFGNRVRARTWLESLSEPTSVWQIDFTDSTHTTGFIGVTTVCGSAGARDLVIDNFNATDTITPSQATLLATGSITASGSLGRSAFKRFAGSITAAGTLIRLKVVARVFTGSITAAGTMRKAFIRTFSGSITAAGSVRRSALKRFAGSVTPAATIRRQAAKRLSGSITPAGSGTPTFIGRIFGRPGIVVISLIQRAEVRIRHRKG
jgi:hypothetical protein